MPPSHEWLEKDYYKVLGVKSDVSEKELTKAYRKVARKYHPDANPDDAKAEDKFKEVSAAYDVIGDPEKRKEYDEVRRLGPAAGMGGGFGGGRGGFGPDTGMGGSRNFGFDGVDLGDILGGMFNGGAAGGRGRPGPSARKGADLETVLHLSFEDAVNGVTTSVHLTSDAACSTCKGSGAKPGTKPTSCSQCGGRGVTDDNQGLFSFSQPCPGCSGRGTIVTDPCSQCAGRGVERRPRQVKVRIPAGVKDGQRIRLKGRGSAGAHGGQSGDLFVVVTVAGHSTFGRSGRNLTVTLPISFADAALGSKLAVPLLNGGSVTLKIAPGTASGKTFRVKGKGVESSSSTGDLLATVEVVVPTELNDEQRQAIEAMAATFASPSAQSEADTST